MFGTVLIETVVLGYFSSNNMFLLFLQLPEKRSRPKWTIYKHHILPQFYEMSVGNFGILSVVRRCRHRRCRHRRCRHRRCRRCRRHGLKLQFGMKSYDTRAADGGQDERSIAMKQYVTVMQICQN